MIAQTRTSRRIFGAGGASAIAPLAFPAGMASAQARDIVDTAVAGQFTTLARALQAAGLVDTLKGPRPLHRLRPHRRRSPSCPRTGSTPSWRTRSSCGRCSPTTWCRGGSRRRTWCACRRPAPCWARACASTPRAARCGSTTRTGHQGRRGHQQRRDPRHRHRAPAPFRHRRAAPYRGAQASPPPWLWPSPGCRRRARPPRAPQGACGRLGARPVATGRPHVLCSRGEEETRWQPSPVRPPRRPSHPPPPRPAGLTPHPHPSAPASGGDVGIQCGQIWLDGKLVPQAQAQVSVLAHALHYGTSVFEGLRAYATPRARPSSASPEHTRRLFDSARIMRMPVPYSEQQLDAAIVETVRVNQWDFCYVRPLIWRGGQTLGVNPMPCPVQVMIATWQWGAYLGEDALLKGARLITSAWVRLPANAMPGKAKAGATTSTPPWPGWTPSAPASTRPSCSTRTASSPKAPGRTSSSSAGAPLRHLLLR